MYALVIGVVLTAVVPESTVRTKGGSLDLHGALLFACAVVALLVPVSFGAT